MGQSTGMTRSWKRDQRRVRVDACRGTRSSPAFARRTMSQGRALGNGRTSADGVSKDAVCKNLGGYLGIGIMVKGQNPGDPGPSSWPVWLCGPRGRGKQSSCAVPLRQWIISPFDPEALTKYFRLV